MINEEEIPHDNCTATNGGKPMRKLLCLFLTLALILASAAAFAEAQPESAPFTPGTYSG